MINRGPFIDETRRCPHGLMCDDLCHKCKLDELEDTLMVAAEAMMVQYRKNPETMKLGRDDFQFQAACDAFCDTCISFAHHNLICKVYACKRLDDSEKAVLEVLTP
jgi:hypothetical protein